MCLILMNSLSLQSLLPYFYWVSGVALLAGLLSVWWAVLILWKNERKHLGGKFVTLAQQFPAWRAILSSHHSDTRRTSLCTDCAFKARTAEGVIVCCAKVKDVFAPHQPILECSAHRSWFSIRASLALTVLICGGMIGGTVLLMRPSTNIQLMRNVHVLDRLDDYNMRLAVEDPDTHMWNSFALTFCRTYRPTSEIAPGVTLSLLKYREDHIHFCADVSDDKFGYTLLRGEHNVPIITYTRQATSQPTTRASN